MDRTQSIISAIVVLIVSIASYFGHTLNPDIIWNALCVAVYIATISWGVYKNHNFTDAALVAQNALSWIKSKETGSAAYEEEVTDIAASHGDNRGE